MRKYIFSIDGNYDSDFDASFFINLLTRYYNKDKGFDTRDFTINSSMSREEILEKLHGVREYMSQDKNCVAFILGGLAEPIISELLETKKIQQTFDNFAEISRIYSALDLKTPSINILLMKNSENKDLLEGFKKIDSMNISMGFKFDLIYVENQKLMESYRQILEIIEKKGWLTPVFPE